MRIKISSSILRSIDLGRVMNFSKRNKEPKVNASPTSKPKEILLVGGGVPKSLKGILFETPREIPSISNSSTQELENIIGSSPKESLSRGRIDFGKRKNVTGLRSTGKRGRK